MTEMQWFLQRGIEMIKYYADFWNKFCVTKREIKSETEKTVIYCSYRESKITKDAAYFGSFKEAQDWLIAKMEKKIAKLKFSLKVEEERLNDVRYQRESDL